MPFLGVPKYIELDSSNDLNEITTGNLNKLYGWSYGVQNAPTNTSLMLVFTRGGRSCQVIFQTERYEIYIRYHRSGEWSEWKTIVPQ